MKNVAVVEWGVVEGAKGSLMEGHYERRTKLNCLVWFCVAPRGCRVSMPIVTWAASKLPNPAQLDDDSDAEYKRDAAHHAKWTASVTLMMMCKRCTVATILSSSTCGPQMPRACSSRMWTRSKARLMVPWVRCHASSTTTTRLDSRCRHCWLLGEVVKPSWSRALTRLLWC